MAAMVPRFYAPLLRRDVAELDLPLDEARHLARVLRLREGASIQVFDGRGLERAATVGRVAKSGVSLVLGNVVDAAPEPRTMVTLGQALLKADRFDDVVRDATMLGVAAIRPLVSARSDVPAAAVRDGGRMDRWRRVAVASVKQCGRAVVPEVFPAVDLAACVAADTSGVRLMLAEPSLVIPPFGAHVRTVGSWNQAAARPTPGPGGQPPERTRAGSDIGALSEQVVPGVSSVLVLVGPEGGWSDDEVALANAAGCRLVTLGRRTLRADAAPLVALSVLLHVLGDL